MVFIYLGNNLDNKRIRKEYVCVPHSKRADVTLGLTFMTLFQITVMLHMEPCLVTMADAMT